ncbi:MAG: 4-hydroxythreonine-4-phosphate dehydrogenase PdxA [Pseudomonadota bacterium]
MTSPIALTCGEPAGAGAELTVKAWRELGNDIPFFWIGDPRHLPAGTEIAEISDPAEVRDTGDRLAVLRHEFSGPAHPGVPNPNHAQDVIDIIARAVSLVIGGRASAVCTNPIHKKTLMDGAGFTYRGHTEYLAALAGVDRVVMMLVCNALKVVPATLHIPLEQVKTHLTRPLLVDTLRITHVGLMRDFGVQAPRLAVAGMNPHAGEGGAIGREEIEIIQPALASLRGEGLNVTGPLSADTMFHPGARAGYDAAICMYHDQALIPIKTLDFARGVNVTLGLPFIRTSPDHGTALDIAGRGIADPSSLIEALRLAHAMARRRAST